MMFEALDKVEKELKNPLMRNDKKRIGLLMAEFDKINKKLGIRKEDLPKYEGKESRHCKSTLLVNLHLTMMQVWCPFNNYRDYNQNISNMFSLPPCKSINNVCLSCATPISIRGSDACTTLNLPEIKCSTTTIIWDTGLIPSSELCYSSSERGGGTQQQRNDCALSSQFSQSSYVLQSQAESWVSPPTPGIEYGEVDDLNWLRKTSSHGKSNPNQTQVISDHQIHTTPDKFTLYTSIRYLPEAATVVECWCVYVVSVDELQLQKSPPIVSQNGDFWDLSPGGPRNCGDLPQKRNVGHALKPSPINSRELAVAYVRTPLKPSRVRLPSSSRMVSALSTSSDDTSNSDSNRNSWPSPVWRRDEQIWDEWRRGWQTRQPAPTATTSSHGPTDDGLHMSDLDDSVGLWVTPAEAQHHRTLAREHAEQLTRIQLLEAWLYNSEDREAAAASMNDMLAERVADISVKFCVMGLVHSRSRKLIKTLVMALIFSLLIILALRFK